MLEENKSLVERYYREVMTLGQGDTVKFDEFVARDAVLHNSYSNPPVGPEEWKHRVRIFTTSFSDVEITLGEVLAEGDSVATQMIYRGTHTGEFLGVPASGKRVAVDEIQIMRIKDGMIVERRSVIDMINLLAQIGATEIPVSYRGSTIPGT
ncbi:ester cyclase [Leisingera sp. JC1]|uniref:ester cyclase n=1 Tax=Leisingera sp. JC1 TaxID=1855282 RepID=UPI000803B009|nr:ester cyclase [Leisingera sp. JC1]OBY26647.1 hypothetical protein A9D60_18470 [Leisingera sp. JC1]